MANPTDHLATVRAALAGLDGVAANRWVHAAADLCNAAPASAALADECAAARDRIATLEAELERLREYAAELTKRREASIRYGIELQHLIEALARGDEPDISERAPHIGRVAHGAWKLLDAARASIATLEAELARAAAPITDDLHPDGCHTTATAVFRDCSGDGHHECRTCTRFDEAERTKRIGEF